MLSLLLIPTLVFLGQRSGNSDGVISGLVWW